MANEIFPCAQKTMQKAALACSEAVVVISLAVVQFTLSRFYAVSLYLMNFGGLRG